jgi:long-chain fatty acid transport protein
MLVVLMAVPAFGAGFSIFEQGAKASGMAGAFAATADDPSAIFYNPAGIAQQRRLAAYAGATFINFSNEFTGDPNSAMTAGVEGKYNRHTFIPPNVYAIVPIGENLTVGFGTYSAWGLRTDWAEPWAGRYISSDADLKTVSFNPTIAWQTSDGRFAIGGGVEYRRARVFLNANRLELNPFTGRITDVANTRLASDYGSDIGYNVGILFKATDRLRFGATYRSDMDIELEGRAEVNQILSGNSQFDAVVKSVLPPNQNIETVFPFPAVASVGVAFSPNENWDVELDVTHMTWSKFEALKVDFKTTPQFGFTRVQNWEDSSAYRLGVNHNATENFDVRLGVLYDQNPQPVEAVSPLLPDSDRIGATFGAGFQHGPWTIDGAAFILHFKDRSTEGANDEDFNGVYQTDAVLWSVNLGYRF